MNISNHNPVSLHTPLTEESKVTGFGPFRKQVKNLTLSLSKTENDSIRVFKKIDFPAFFSYFDFTRKWHEKKFTTIQVYNSDKKEIEQFFVKIDDLAKKLGLSNQVIKIKLDSENATTLIVSKRPHLTGETYDHLINTNQNKPDEFNASIIAIKTFIKDEKKFKKLVEDIPHWSETMVATIVELGKKIEAGEIKEGSETYVKSTKDPWSNKKTTYAYLVSADKKIYIVKEKLGAGAFKKVSSAIELTEQKPVVRAAIIEKPEHDYTQKFIEDSLTVYSNLQGEHIVPPYELAIDTKTNIRTGGKYKKVAIQAKFDGDCEKLGEKKVSAYHLLTISLHTAKGLSHIHKLGYIHSDVKPGNILVKGDVTNPKQHVQAFVSDFDLLNKGEYIGGSPLYLAPEIKGLNSGDKITLKVDSFALGVMLMDMLTGSSYLQNERFADTTVQTIDSFIDSKKMKDPQSTEDKIRNELFDLAKQLLNPNVDNRLSCAEAAKKLETLSEKYPFPVVA